MSGKQRDLSTEWTPWVWSDKLGCKYSTRYGPTGEVEYDYLESPPAGGQDTSHDSPTGEVDYDYSDPPGEERLEIRPRYGGEMPSTEANDDTPNSPDSQSVYTHSTEVKGSDWEPQRQNSRQRFASSLRSSNKQTWPSSDTAEGFQRSEDLPVVVEQETLGSTSQWSPRASIPLAGSSSVESQKAYTTSIAQPKSSSSNFATSNWKVRAEYAPKDSAGMPGSSRRQTQPQGDMAQILSTLSLGDALPLVQVQAPDGQTHMASHINTNFSNNMLDNRYVEIDERKNKKFWKPGRVFMMLWTEPARARPPARTAADGTTGSQYDTVWLGSTVYSEIRRFVVIGEGYGNVICSPIHTYSGQATLKCNLPDPLQHAIIYTSSSPPDELWAENEYGEIIRENLSKDPIRVKSELPGADGDLGRLSRINYAKIYTVEKYVRVLNIGKVHENSMESLLASCFFARPPEEPPQGPRRTSHSNKTRDSHDRRDDNSGKRPDTREKRDDTREKRGDTREKKDDRDKRDRDSRDDRGQSSRSHGHHGQHRRK